MSTIIPNQELQRRAIQWISEGLTEGKKLCKLIEEAAIRFNMSPKDVEFLNRFYKEQNNGREDC